MVQRLKKAQQATRALLILFAVLFAGRYWLHVREQAALNAIRADGYPVTLEELNAWYAIPEGENAADTYALAFDALASANPPRRSCSTHLDHFSVNGYELRS